MASDLNQVLGLARWIKAGQQGLSLEVGGAWSCSSRRCAEADTHSRMRLALARALFVKVRPYALPTRSIWYQLLSSSLHYFY
jgi:hypothetical protein